MCCQSCVEQMSTTISFPSWDGVKMKNCSLSSFTKLPIVEDSNFGKSTGKLSCHCMCNFGLRVMCHVVYGKALGRSFEEFILEHIHPQSTTQSVLRAGMILSSVYRVRGVYAVLLQSRVYCYIYHKFYWYLCLFTYCEVEENRFFPLFSLI